MQFLTSSLICVLTLLPTLSLAASTPPLLTTLKKPFSLRTATPERFNIATYISEVSPRFQANRNVTFLQLSRTSSKLPQFKLTNGTLTTADDLFTAFRLFGEPIDPPDFIRAIAFGNADTRKFLGVIESTYAAKRVSKTFKKGGEGSGLQLITTSGAIVVGQALEENKTLFIKPLANTQDYIKTVTVPLDIIFPKENQYQYQY